MLEALAPFHLLRPAWLLALIPVAILAWTWLRRERRASQWGGAIAPHLLKHLVIQGGEPTRWRPIVLLVLIGLVGSVALAGPTWRREPSPFAQDVAGLVVVIDLSRSMDATDVQPSRLARAQIKVAELLEARGGGRQALVVYAGSAHLVMPMTEDYRTINDYVGGLATDIMPVAGENAAEALHLAEDVLNREPVPGTIVFVTDGVAEGDLAAFAEHAESSRNRVLLLGIGTEGGGTIAARRGGGVETNEAGQPVVVRLDRGGLARLADEAGVGVVLSTVDDSDVQRLTGQVQRALMDAQNEDGAQRWADAGYYLVVPLSLLLLLWFRPGWLIRWAVVLITLGAVFRPGTASADEWRFMDLWLTADQQGRYHFERGEYETAGERFEDPLWRGVAFYAAEDFDRAVAQFSRVETAEGFFNLGNALAHLAQYEAAVLAYEQALEYDADRVAAAENRDLLLAIIEANRESEPPLAEPTELSADQFEIEEGGEPSEGGERIEAEVAMEGLTDEQIADMWLSRVDPNPADFLRARFSFEAARGREGE